MDIHFVPKKWQAEMFARPSKMIKEMFDQKEWYDMVMFELFDPETNDFMAPQYGTEDFKKLMLEKYGVEHQMHLEEVKQKIIQTLMETYGVTNAFQINQKEIMLEKHGVDNPMKLDWVKENHKQSLLQKYGVTNAFQINQKEIMLEKYGVENTMQLESTKENHKQSILQKYGVGNVSQIEEVKEKKRQKEKQKQQRPMVKELKEIQKQHGLTYGAGWSQKRDEDLEKLYKKTLLQLEEGSNNE